MELTSASLRQFLLETTLAPCYDMPKPEEMYLEVFWSTVPAEPHRQVMPDKAQKCEQSLQVIPAPVFKSLQANQVLSAETPNKPSLICLVQISDLPNS